MNVNKDLFNVIRDWREFIFQHSCYVKILEILIGDENDIYGDISRIQWWQL